MAGIKSRRGGIAVRLRRGTGRVAAVEQIAHVGGHAGFQFGGIAQPDLGGNQRRLQHQASQRAGPSGAILQCQRAAPTAAQHMPARDAEVDADRLDLRQETRHRPVGRIARPIGTATIQLIIQDHGAIIGQRRGVEPAPVRTARPAMDKQDRRFAAQGAVDPDIDTPAGNRHHGFLIRRQPQAGRRGSLPQRLRGQSRRQQARQPRRQPRGQNRAPAHHAVGPDLRRKPEGSRCMSISG